jgi:hypothetical protein
LQAGVQRGDAAHQHPQHKCVRTGIRVTANQATCTYAKGRKHWQPVRTGGCLSLGPKSHTTTPLTHECCSSVPDEAPDCAMRRWFSFTPPPHPAYVPQPANTPPPFTHTTIALTHQWFCHDSVPKEPPVCACRYAFACSCGAGQGIRESLQKQHSTAYLVRAMNTTVRALGPWNDAVSSGVGSTVQGSKCPFVTTPVMCRCAGPTQPGLTQRLVPCWACFPDGLQGISFASCSKPAARPSEKQADWLYATRQP